MKERKETTQFGKAVIIGGSCGGGKGGWSRAVRGMSMNSSFHLRVLMKQSEPNVLGEKIQKTLALQM